MSKYTILDDDTHQRATQRDKKMSSLRENDRIYLTDWPTFEIPNVFTGTGGFEGAPQRLVQVQLLHCGGSEPGIIAGGMKVRAELSMF